VIHRPRAGRWRSDSGGRRAGTALPRPPCAIGGCADEETRAHVAGAASAAAAEVEPAAAVVPDLTAAAFFDVDNTMMVGASIFWFARGLAARKYLTARDMSRFVWQQAKFRIAGNESADDMLTIRESALAFVAGRPVSRSSRPARRSTTSSWPTGSGPARGCWPSSTSTPGSGCGW
jgi:hypothetical protein